VVVAGAADVTCAVRRHRQASAERTRRSAGLELALTATDLEMRMAEVLVAIAGDANHQQLKMRYAKQGYDVFAAPAS
jgi:hypothetical protein